MMRILQINASYKPAYIYGGPTMSVGKLCEEVGGQGSEDRGQRSEVRGQRLEDRGWKSYTLLEVYTTLANGKEEFNYPSGATQLVEGVKVRYFKRWTKDHSHFSPALLWHLWNNVKKFDVVHIHAWWNLVSVLSCWIAVIKGVPVLLTPRGTLSPYSFINSHALYKRIFHFLLGKPILKKVHFHLTSEKESVDTQKLFRGKSFRVIPNFVQLSEKQAEHVSFETRPLQLIFLSRIDHKKGLELLFESLSHLNFPFNISIAGAGEGDYVEGLKLQAKNLKIEQHIKWLGSIYGEEKFKLLAQHHLLVLPSYDENFANVVIESLSVGTPVLLSKQVGLADYVKQQQLGLVCERNIEDFRKAIIELENNRSSLAELSKRSRSQIKKDFNADLLRNEYLELYQNIINESL
ncbi:MAG: glycosyltransferase [Pelobium sp.]